MTPESKKMAGLLLAVFPTVIIGGVSLLSFLIDPYSVYMENPLRHNLWRAGHAHSSTSLRVFNAGVMLVLFLICLRYVDEAQLSDKLKWLVRLAVPSAAIFLPMAFFLSVLSPTATKPNGFIYLAFVGAVLLAIGLLTLGVGLLRKKQGAAV